MKDYKREPISELFILLNLRMEDSGIPLSLILKENGPLEEMEEKVSGFVVILPLPEVTEPLLKLNTESTLEEYPLQKNSKLKDILKKWNNIKLEEDERNLFNISLYNYHYYIIVIQKFQKKRKKKTITCKMYP